MSIQLKSVPSLVTMGANYEEHCDQVFNMEVRADDVWIVTPPKCGTTWTQVNSIEMECDYLTLFVSLILKDFFLVNNY